MWTTLPRRYLRQGGQYTKHFVAFTLGRRFFFRCCLLLQSMRPGYSTRKLPPQRWHRCRPTSPLVHMTQASNMTISAREFQLVMEVVHRWTLLVNGQHALCDAPRCGLCGKACALSDLSECEQCGVKFSPYCCASCMSEDDQFLCYICFSLISPIWYVA